MSARAGAGGESLLLTYGQIGRRSRVWWSNVLDQFSAADVHGARSPSSNGSGRAGRSRGISPPATAPTTRFLGSFTMTAPDEQGLPAMLDQAVARFDAIFSQALADGKLRPDPTLYAGNRFRSVRQSRR